MTHPHTLAHTQRSTHINTQQQTYTHNDPHLHTYTNTLTQTVHNRKNTTILFCKSMTQCSRDLRIFMCIIL